MTNNDKLILYVWHNFISHLLSVICFLIDSSKIAELTQQITRKVILLLQHIDKNVMSWNLTTRSSAVTGGDVVGECGRLSQLSFWAHYNIAYLLTHLPTCCAAKYCHLLWYLLLLFARLCRCRKVFGSAIYYATGEPVCISVCPSLCPSHSWVTPKRFKISKYALHHTIEGCFFSWGQISPFQI